MFRTTTSTLLLDALRDGGNDPAWREFDERYRPIIIGFARTLGVPPADAEDVAQHTLMEFLRAYRDGRYDRSRGRLRAWIMGIARHRAADLRERRARRREFRGESAVGALPDEARLTAIWEAQRERVLFERAMKVVREESRLADKTIRAFELVALQGTPAAEAAAQCGMTADEVYVAKNRVLKRLREIVAELTRAYEEDAPAPGNDAPGKDAPGTGAPEGDAP